MIILLSSRTLIKIKLPTSSREQRVVPFAMEFSALQLNLRELFVTDFDSRFILGFVKCGSDD